MDRAVERTEIFPQVFPISEEVLHTIIVSNPPIVIGAKLHQGMIVGHVGGIVAGFID